MSAALEISATMDVRTMALEDQTRGACDAIMRGDYIAAMRWLGNLAANFTELAADVAQEAYNSGATKKAIADALGVTPATFRGMERTR